MLKQISLSFAAAALLTISCSVKEDRILCTAPVRVSVNGFTVTQEDLPAPTRAPQDVTDVTNIQVLTLAFYSGDTETYKTRQTRGALAGGETFGVFDLSLPMGSYTMVVIAQGLAEGETPIVLSSPTEASFGNNPTRNLFLTTRTVEIHSADAVDISATLNRVTAVFQVKSSDVRTAGAAQIRLTVRDGGKTFDPTSGLATSHEGNSRTIPISAEVGEVSTSNIYALLNSDEQDMEVTIETLDGNQNVLFSKTIQNVPFKRNRRTILTGAIYTNSSTGGSFQVDPDWQKDYNGTF